MRASQVVSALLGALLCVLAWRLAADVAEERGLAPGRARTLAIGTGLTAAVYLPLLLHAVQPDSTILFGVLALGACLLMTRVLRDPRGARLLDPRLLAMGLLLGAAALTRNEAVWLALVWAWLAWRRSRLAARGAPPADRRGRRREPAGVRAVGRPQLGRVRQPAARPGGLQRAVGHRVRHLRLERPAHPVAVPRGGPGAARRDAGGGPRPQRVQRPAAAGHPALGDRPPGAAVAGPRPRAAAGGARRRDHVPRHEPAVPGRHDLGHVPPRGGARSTCCSSSPRSGRSTPGWPASGRRIGWTRPVAWLGAVLAVGGSALFSVALLPDRSRRRRATPRAPTRCWRARWRRSARRSTARARSSTTSRSGSPRRSACRRSRCPTRRRRTCWTSPTDVRRRAG